MVQGVPEAGGVGDSASTVGVTLPPAVGTAVAVSLGSGVTVGSGVGVPVGDGWGVVDGSGVVETVGSTLGEAVAVATGVAEAVAVGEGAVSEVTVSPIAAAAAATGLPRSGCFVTHLGRQRRHSSRPIRSWPSGASP